MSPNRSFISIKIDDDLIQGAESVAQELTLKYGVPVSRSEVIRRAIAAFLLSNRSIDRPDDIKKTAHQPTEAVA